MSHTSEHLPARSSEAQSTFGERIDDDTIRFERHFAVPPERVWKAIVTPEALAAWLGQPLTIEMRVGGVFEIRFNAEDRMNGRVLECESNRRLVLAWCEDSNGVPSRHATRADDESLVTFELTPASDGGTELVLTHRYIRPDQMIGFGGGWHAHLDALDALLDGAGLPDRVERYERLRPAYELRFRPG